MSSRHRQVAAAAVLAVAVVMRAQETQPPQYGPIEQYPFGQPPMGTPAGTMPVPIVPGQLPIPSLVRPAFGTMMPAARDPARTGWVLPRTDSTFGGFPLLTQPVPGLGGYPSPSGLAPGLLPRMPFPSTVPPEPPGWPAWVRAKGGQTLPYGPEVALLVRNGERVWYRPDGEEPFVPLYFHDNVRALGAGASVEVRHNGEFELLLHDSTRVQSRGRSRVDVLALAPARVALRVTEVTWLRVAASAREHEITLPDGSLLRIAAPPAPVAAAGAPDAPSADAPPFVPPPVPMSAPTPGVTELVLERVSEPGWLGGRATLTNLGGTDVTVGRGGSTITLTPSQRMTLLLRAPAAYVPAELALDGAAMRADGDAVTCSAERPATVSWSGAAFALPAGASVRFDPQQGRPFATPPPAPPAPQPPR